MENYNQFHMHNCIAGGDESSVQVQESSPTFFLSRVIVDLYHVHLVVLSIIILSIMSA